MRRSDYLPAEARKTNEVALTVVEDVTAGALIEQCSLPKKLAQLFCGTGTSCRRLRAGLTP
jgi:hypothetical protein